MRLLAGVAWRDSSTFTLGSAVLAPQLAKAETAAPKSAIAADPAQILVTKQFMIDAVDPGIKLYVRNKRTEDLKQFTSDVAVRSRCDATFGGDF